MMEWCTDVNRSSSSFFSLSLVSSFFWDPKQSVQSSVETTQEAVTCDPRAPLRVLRFSGCTTLPVCADSSLLKVISSSITISFHISLSPSGENARCQSKWKFTLSSNKELNCKSESILTGEQGMKGQIGWNFGTRNAQVNFLFGYKSQYLDILCPLEFPGTKTCSSY